MVNNIKAFWRYSATGLGVLFGFVVFCLVSTALFGPESLFANYLRGGIMMFFIISPILSSSLVRSLVNIGLAMGAVRKSLWGTMELAIAAQALVCLPMQAMLDWGAEVLTPEEAGLSLTLPARGLSGLALFLLLWAMGAMGSWLSLVEKTSWKIFGWGLVMLLYIAYMAAMIAHMIFSFFGMMDVILWSICGVSLVVGGAASYGLYRKCRSAQVNLL
ncbi:hypothetical protein [Allofournierella massiliensis]|uniref:Uncharacterized protein n=1 Tax=Allofournierella massiliensis TaxID=1650663 RepID=A0ABT7UU52_9FIRM|nr:hypothetical protein [Fournierella massiliensis]MDM8202270.1 hypothetical protein [Fournierella massiliensis]